MSFPSTNPPSHFSLTARQVCEAKIISIGEKSARVMFGGRTWDISVYDKTGSAPKDLQQNSDLVEKITSVFEILVQHGVIDPTQHKSVEIEESKDRTDIKSSVKVFTSQDITGKVQTISEHTKVILNGFGLYLFNKGLSTSPASLHTSLSKQVDITKLSTGQKAHLIQQLLDSQKNILCSNKEDAKKYDGQFLAFYDKENTPLTEFLGNFYEIEGGFTYKGKKYKCSEAAYQASKLEYLNQAVCEGFIKNKINSQHENLKNLGINLSECKDVNDFKTKLYAAFQEASGDQALKIARCLHEIKNQNHPFKTLITEEFHETKIQSMQKIIYDKFSQNPELKNLLLATGNSYLIEHRYINAKDDFWSDGGNCQGKNVLGKLLMEVREDLRKNENLRLKDSTDNLEKNDIPEFVKNIYKNPAVNLDPFSKADLSKSSYIIPLDSHLKYIDGKLVHKDVGGGGRCADLSLADQYLTKTKIIINTPENRDKLSQIFRQDAAGYLKSNNWNRDQDIFNKFKTAIVSTLRHCELPDDIKNVYGKSNYTDEDYKKMANFYADLISKNPNAYLDTLFFLALAHNDNQAKDSPKVNIQIVQDRTPQAPSQKPFKEVFTQNSNESQAVTLTIWYNGSDHYHSYVGSQDLIEK